MNKTRVYFHGGLVVLLDWRESLRLSRYTQGGKAQVMSFTGCHVTEGRVNRIHVSR